MIPSVDYIRILPELVLSVFGIIVMMADPLIPEQNSKKPLGIVAVVGVITGLAATAYQTGFYGNAFYDTVSVDTFSVFFHVVVLLIALVVHSGLIRISRRTANSFGRVLRAGLVRHGGHDVDVRCRGVGPGLYCARNFVDLHLYSRRHAAACCGERGSVAEIFSAGLVCHRILPLRRRSNLRRYRYHQRLRHRPLFPDPAAFDAGLSCCGIDVRRPRLQGCLGALPCVDARCLRRLARAGGCLDVNRTEGRSVCGFAAGAVSPPALPAGSG